MFIQFLTIGWYTYMYPPCWHREWSCSLFCYYTSQLADMTGTEGEGKGNVVLANKH